MNKVRALDQSATLGVLEEVRAERENQEVKWGEQNWPVSFPSHNPEREPLPGWQQTAMHLLPSEELAKAQCQSLNQSGRLTYGVIAVEELSEAVATPTEEARRKEWIQVAAVAVAAVEAIDRRARRAGQAPSPSDRECPRCDGAGRMRDTDTGPGDVCGTCLGSGHVP